MNKNENENEEQLVQVGSHLYELSGILILSSDNMGLG